MSGCGPTTTAALPAGLAAELELDEPDELEQAASRSVAAPATASAPAARLEVRLYMGEKSFPYVSAGA